MIILDTNKSNFCNKRLVMRVNDNPEDGLEFRILKNGEIDRWNGYDITFYGLNAQNKKVIGGKVTRVLDDIVFVFPKNSFSAEGYFKRAYFKLQYGSKILTSGDFEIEVINDIGIDKQEAEDIISLNDEIKKVIQDIADKAENKAQTALDTTNKFAKKLDELAKQNETGNIVIANEVINARNGKKDLSERLSSDSKMVEDKIKVVNESINKNKEEINKKRDKTDKIESSELGATSLSLINSKRDSSKSLTMSDMGQDVKEAMTGGSVAVVGKDAVDTINLKDNSVSDTKLKDNSVSNSKIKEGAVSSDKVNVLAVDNINMSFDTLTDQHFSGKNKIFESVNLFNKNNIKKGYYVDNYGSLKKAAGDSIFTSVIKVNSAIKYTVSRILSSSGAFFDSKMNFISKLSDKANTENVTLDIPHNAEYMAINGDATVNEQTFMVVEGSKMPSVYVPYNKIYKLDWLNDEINKISLDNFETRQELVNLFDKNSIEKDKVLLNDGTIASSDMFVISDYIKINKYKKYYFSAAFSSQGCIYDENKKFISQIPTDPGENIDVFRTFNNKDDYYIRVNIYRSGLNDIEKNIDGFMIVRTQSIPKKYIEYGVEVKGLKISDKNIIKTDKPISDIKLVTLGDSITWYDSHNFNDNTNFEGEKVIGYQTHIRNRLGFEVDNFGISGATTKKIFDDLKNKDLKKYNIISVFCGTNDFRDHSKNNFGEVKSKKSNFDETTFLGAYQSMVEHLKIKYIEKQLVLITPFQIHTKDNGYIPKKYIDSIIEIAEMYSIPVVNLYKNGMIDELNYHKTIADKEEMPYRFHPSNLGYEFISVEILKEFEKYFTIYKKG